MCTCDTVSKVGRVEAVATRCVLPACEFWCALDFDYMRTKLPRYATSNHQYFNEAALRIKSDASVLLCSNPVLCCVSQAGYRLADLLRFELKESPRSRNGYCSYSRSHAAYKVRRYALELVLAASFAGVFPRILGFVTEDQSQQRCVSR